MEEIKKIEVQGQQYGVADMLMRSVMGGNAQVIEWSHTHNMNDYKEAGTYRIKGERTGNPLDDNLPIMNSGSGHTIEGILYVLDSSLANGSGKEDDCTVTQFLILSNRVGGQEGDMYMRSAYGANKDSLTWKPWEKYQTNMEVGAVSDYKLLNPSNPTEILKHDSGMNHIIDNGIYSGIYFGPKCMVGTGEDDWHISFQNAAAIETFVMVVINNYAAASNARCITQIKFAVTNGGVFSMEKRTYTTSWSEWESVGGGAGQEIPKYRIKLDESTPVTNDLLSTLNALPVGKECIFYSSGSDFVSSYRMEKWGMSIPEDWDGSTALGSVFEHFLGLCYLNGGVSHVAPIEFKFKKVLLNHLDGSIEGDPRESFIVDAFATSDTSDKGVTAKYVVNPVSLYSRSPLSFSINQPKEFIQYWNSTSDAENYKTVPSTINEFIIYSGGSTLHHLCGNYAGDKYKITEGFYKDFNDNFCSSDSHSGTAIFKCKNIKAKLLGLYSCGYEYRGNLIEVEATYLDARKSLPVSGAKYLVYSKLSEGAGGRTWNYYLTDNFVRTSEWTSQEQAAE